MQVPTIQLWGLSMLCVPILLVVPKKLHQHIPYTYIYSSSICNNKKKTFKILQSLLEELFYWTDTLLVVYIRQKSIKTPFKNIWFGKFNSFCASSE